ncbi:hypothetical protein [Tropicimonas marinistellae]|uniref:hypothetical protein n=1 Tax=Tropicimonas marinistellae TaxID=1739787 RepID=UPI00082ECE6E|nr:hypothetical protein [Tropicimonas marinistellae]
MKRGLLLALATCAAGSALAEPLECSFTTECYEAEGCHDTDYGFMVWFPSETNAQVVTITDQTGDYPGQAEPLGTEGRVIRFVSGFGPSMLTLHGTAARLSAHSGSEAMMVTYAGTCREVE